MPDLEDRHALGVGLATAKCVFFVLDRRRVLFMQDPQDGRPEAVVKVGEDWARKVNGIVAKNARRWIFCHPADPIVDDF